MLTRIISYISLNALIFTLFSCRPVTENESTLRFPDTLMCSDKICLPITTLEPRDILVSDSFIIVKQNHESKIVKVYNRNNYKLLGSMLSVGKGPNEILKIPKISQWKFSGDTVLLFIRSYPKSWMWIDVSRSLDSGKLIVNKEYNFISDKEKRKISLSSGAVYDIGNDSLVMRINPNQMDKPQRNPNPYFILFDYKRSRYTDSVYVQNFAFSEGMQPMLFSGSSSISINHHTLVQAYLYMNSIDFFNFKTLSKKTVFFSADAKDYKKFIEKPSYRFKETCGTKDYVYILKDQANKGDSLIGSSICVFSWDAKPVCELRFEERINYFFVDDKSSELFAIDYDEKIWRYKMPTYNELSEKWE